MARVLVIDDDDQMRALAVELLEAEGYQADSAADGTAGLGMAYEDPPDLVLCDVMMRGIDGYDVLAALRRDPRTATVPVIFFTGVGGASAVRQGMNLGADDYLVKPVSTELLIQAVRARLVRSAQMRQEAAQRLEQLRNELARSLLPHELLTPLTAVMALSSLLMEEGVIEPAEVKEVATAAQWISVGEFPNAAMVPVTDAYFDMLKIPVVSGRSFNRSDTPDSLPVAIVNSSLARKYWPNEDPIGKQIRQGYPAQPYGPWRTIVGVVGDIKQHGVDQETPRQVFLPIVQQPRTTAFAIVRTRVALSSSSIESAIQELDRSIPVFNDRTVDQVMGESSRRRRVAMIVLSVFGAVALLLAAIGLYGVIAQGVAERRQEIGVRMALGATRGQVVRLFLRQGLVVVALGIGCGVMTTVAAAQSLASLVFGVTATDPGTLVGVAALLAAVTLLACYLPSRSATRVDPMAALRLE